MLVGMKILRLSRSIVLLSLLVGCAGAPVNPTATVPVITLPPPVLVTPETTPTPVATPTPQFTNPLEVAERYVRAWEQNDYAQMYTLLTAAERAARPEVDFATEYTRVLEAMTVLSFSVQLGQAEPAETQLALPGTVTYHTGLVGTLTTPITVTLQQEGDRWGVVFARTALLSELAGGNRLLMVPLIPQRGTIYDRNGVPLAWETEAFSFGVVPGELGEGFDAAVRGLSGALGIPAPVLAARLQNAVPNQYLALGELSAEEYASRYRYLSGITGVYVFSYTARYYRGNGAVAHVTGYTTFIPQNRLTEFRARGYAGSERVGVAGVELWAEAQLAGKAGGQLQLRTAEGQFIKMLAATQQVPSQDVYTTIDYNLQAAAQAALGDFTGAVVAMDPKTGEIWALASGPTFSPNIFEPQNRNQSQIALVLNDPRRPLLNHASQSTYAPGSVFKIITMAAGLTSGQFTPDSVWDCNGEWRELGASFVRTDWLEGGHGSITLKQGLSGSCNPWFWHIGYSLFNFNPQWLPDTAKGFGLGQRTGLEIEESAGLIPDDAWKRQALGEAWTVFDSVNMSIGQGDVQATPVQMARMIAAIANGGTLYRPGLVLAVRPPNAEPTYEFNVQAVGQLPVLPEHLAAIREGMENVTREPIGTARNRFRNFRIPVAGKTGTAEAGGQQPDAWFGGFTYANNANTPDLAMAVVVQNRGQGSDYAAPIFRRVVEAHFGLNFVRYPWEESVGVPAPEETPTPAVP